MGSELLKKLLAEAQALSKRIESGFDFSDEALCTDVIVHVERAVVELRQAAIYIPARKPKDTSCPFEVHMTDDGGVDAWAAFARRSEAIQAAKAKAKQEGWSVYGYRKGQRYSTDELDECEVFYLYTEG